MKTTVKGIEITIAQGVPVMAQQKQTQEVHSNVFYYTGYNTGDLCSSLSAAEFIKFTGKMYPCFPCLPPQP